MDMVRIGVQPVDRAAAEAQRERQVLGVGAVLGAGGGLLFGRSLAGVITGGILGVGVAYLGWRTGAIGALLGGLQK